MDSIPIRFDQINICNVPFIKGWIRTTKNQCSIFTISKKTKDIVMYYWIFFLGAVIFEFLTSSSRTTNEYLFNQNEKIGASTTPWSTMLLNTGVQSLVCIDMPKIPSEVCLMNEYPSRWTTSPKVWWFTQAPAIYKIIRWHHRE